ncbi:hypothetical protein GCM10011579_027110 [Streptomyces albiflavescens]|uniref:Calcium-binding protein n=1 Tax=Streptomyces albiflavescens TaxID=1623582 RepID=A0A917Y110_9ACTN|nr:DUF5707 domain-containing protein [Streptomyces albiflavescens]GGN61135.1 hypothetical protein GCM10011579_027110 [Streptomyces albiflavescens]
MRIRATVAAVSGALALSAFVVPGAHAADVPSFAKPDAASRFDASTKSAFATAADEPTISNVTVNGGKDIVLGTTTTKTITVSLTATHASGIEDAYIDLWHGTDVETDIDGLLVPNEDAATCTAASATTSTCKLTITVDPQLDLYANSLAGTWHVTAAALATDGSMYWNDYYKTARVQRYSKLTVNAGPEPVSKGATLTATGKLSRANWEDHLYHGYTNQPVKLQFRKAGTSTYTTVKTVYSDSTGNLKATTTANYDGYWRFSFAGTTTTPAVSATGDYVDVR